MSSRARLLGSLLLIVAPTGCGSDASSTTGTTDSATGGYGGSGQAGAAGAAPGGQAGQGPVVGGQGGAAGGQGGQAGEGPGGQGPGGGGQAGAGQGGMAGGGQAGLTGSWCAEGKPVVIDGEPTGVYRCPDNRLVRREVRACPASTSGPSTCSVDGDCGAGSICLCAQAGGQCVPAQCSTAADCPGQECAYYFKPAGQATTTPPCWVAPDGASEETGMACTTPGDKCDGSLCPAYTSTCMPVGTVWQCKESIQCGAGRPLVVEQVARVARLRVASAWG